MKRFSQISALTASGLAAWFLVRESFGEAAAPIGNAKDSVVEGLTKAAEIASAHPQSAPSDADLRLRQRKPAKVGHKAPIAIASSALLLEGGKDDEGDEEDEEILASDNTPEQRIWRAAWLTEKEDPVWTQEIADELKTKAQLLVKGDLSMHGLSCRETVCRVYLQFSEQSDAQAIMASEHDSSRRYEYQSLSPEIEEEDNPQARYEFEMLIAREKPGANLHGESATHIAENVANPAENRKAPAADTPRVSADSEKLITIVSHNKDGR